MILLTFKIKSLFPSLNFIWNAVIDQIQNFNKLIYLLYCITNFNLYIAFSLSIHIFILLFK